MPPVFGTAYYPDHWPDNEWERDLGAIRDAGLTVVRFGEFSWSWYEPSCGKFDFRAFDRFVGLA
jgi:beta-galactosidase